MTKRASRWRSVLFQRSTWVVSPVSLPTAVCCSEGDDRSIDSQNRGGNTHVRSGVIEWGEPLERVERAGRANAKKQGVCAGSQTDHASRGEPLLAVKSQLEWPPPITIGSDS